MKLLGILLMISGWVVAMAAVRLLHGPALPVFILAGFGVELLGLVLLARSHVPVSGEQR